MGSNNGTGQPYWFRCAKCRSTTRGGDGGWLGDVTLTGRRRKHRGRVGDRITHIDREYVCGSCGHTGWSAHIDLCHEMGDHQHASIEDGQVVVPSYARL